MHIIGSSCHLHFSHKRGVFKVNVVATYNDRIDVTCCGNWTLTDCLTVVLQGAAINRPHYAKCIRPTVAVILNFPTKFSDTVPEIV